MTGSFATQSRVSSILPFLEAFLLGKLPRHQCFLENTLNPFDLEKGVTPGWHNVEMCSFCLLPQCTDTCTKLQLIYFDMNSFKSIFEKKL